MTPILELRNIRGGYGTIDVLHGVNLTVEPGQVHALLGPNGAGKTTTLGVCSGQIAPSGGQLLISGRDVNGATSDALARAGVCLVPEGRGIFPNLTVTENLRMFTHAGDLHVRRPGAGLHPVPPAQGAAQAGGGTMSGGEQQMLAMARALATEPGAAAARRAVDGPGAPIIVEELYERVAELAAQGVSILVVEQFAQAVLGVSTVASIMLHGRITRTGPPAEIAEELTEAYLGATADPTPA